MRVIRPSYPSRRSVSAVLAPAIFAPTIPTDDIRAPPPAMVFSLPCSPCLPCLRGSSCALIRTQSHPPDTYCDTNEHALARVDNTTPSASTSVRTPGHTAPTAPDCPHGNGTGNATAVTLFCHCSRFKLSAVDARSTSDWRLLRYWRRTPSSSMASTVLT